MRSICEQVEALQPVKYLFLTLTIENPPLTELNDALKTMNRAFNLLTKSPEFKDVLGYFRATELLGGKTKRGEAHPHFHVLLVVKPEYFTKGHYVSQSRWCEVWQRCLKVDYAPVVDVRKVKPKREGLSARDSAIFEVAKYQVKPQEIKKLTKRDFKILDLQTKGTRQYARGGLLKVLKPREGEELDPAIWEKLKREFYQWVGGKYKET
jgi:plasmid rolling circle replication initiator protein Rep